MGIIIKSDGYELAKRALDNADKCLMSAQITKSLPIVALSIGGEVEVKLGGAGSVEIEVFTLSGDSINADVVVTKIGGGVVSTNAVNAPIALINVANLNGGSYKVSLKANAAIAAARLAVTVIGGYFIS